MAKQGEGSRSGVMPLQLMVLALLTFGSTNSDRKVCSIIEHKEPVVLRRAIRIEAATKLPARSDRNHSIFAR